jgi:hypothetical protein
MATVAWPWAILLCRFADRPQETRPREFYEDLYTRNGTGGVCDYWRTVSCGTLDHSGSRVFGWFRMPRTTAEAFALRFPAERGRLIDWGVEAATAAGVDLSPFRSVLVVQNAGIDHGAAGGRVLVVDQDPALCEYGFICHEMGHGLGLGHTWAADPDREYGDGWDVMSFATTTFQFTIAFNGAAGAATVGLNGPNLEKLGAVPPGRTWTPSGPDFSAEVVLDPLSQPLIGNRGKLLVKLPPWASAPPRPSGSTYFVELHRRAGWDQAIPRDAVSVREVRADGRSFLQTPQEMVVGDRFETPDPRTLVQVTALAAGSATVRLWDLPDGSLRKEDSKPRVYLIEGGRKRWVTSPDALGRLGRTWDDVRPVPDGALSGLPDGPDVAPSSLLQVAAVTASGGLWHAIRASDGSWSAFGDVEGPAGDRGTIVDADAAHVGGELHMTAIGASPGQVWHAVRRGDGSWTTFGDVEGQAGERGALARVGVAGLAGELHVCALTGAGPLWHAIRRADGSWTAFGDVEGAAGERGTIRAVGCGAAGGQLHVCAVTSAGRLWHAVRFPSGDWSPFGDVEGQTGDRGTITDTACAGVRGELHVCAVNSAGGLWHAIRRGDGSWTPFGDVEGPAGERGRLVRVAVAAAAGELHVCTVNTAGQLWHAIRRQDGSWTPLGDIEGQAGERGAIAGVAAAGLTTA